MFPYILNAFALVNYTRSNYWKDSSFMCYDEIIQNFNMEICDLIIKYT